MTLLIALKEMWLLFISSSINFMVPEVESWAFLIIGK